MRWDKCDKWRLYLRSPETHPDEPNRATVEILDAGDFDYFQVDLWRGGRWVSNVFAHEDLETAKAEAERLALLELL